MQAMHTVVLTPKGQVMIPADLRLKLGLKPGIRLNIEIHNGNLTLMPVFDDIKAAFGLLKAKKSVSLAEMDAAIMQEAAKQDDQS